MSGSGILDEERAGCDEGVGDSLQGTGVTLDDRAEDADVFGPRVEAPNIEEVELVWDVAEPPVLGMSGCGESWSSTARIWVSAQIACGRRAAPFASQSIAAVVSRDLLGPYSLSVMERPDPVCLCASLTLGALGKYCAKPTVVGGRAIVSMSSGYLNSQAAIMISRVGTQKFDDTAMGEQMQRPSTGCQIRGRARASTRPERNASKKGDKQRRRDDMQSGSDCDRSRAAQREKG